MANQRGRAAQHQADDLGQFMAQPGFIGKKALQPVEPGVTFHVAARFQPGLLPPAPDFGLIASLDMMRVGGALVQRNQPYKTPVGFYAVSDSTQKSRGIRQVL